LSTVIPKPDLWDRVYAGDPPMSKGRLCQMQDEGMSCLSSAFPGLLAHCLKCFYILGAGTMSSNSSETQGSFRIMLRKQSCNFNI
jgi:hypothetical protein